MHILVLLNTVSTLDIALVNSHYDVLQKYDMKVKMDEVDFFL